jgi:hypothetical protein
MLLYPWSPKSASGPRSVGNLVRIGAAIASKAKLRQIDPLVEADADPFTVYPGYMSIHEQCAVEANRNPLPFCKGDIVAKISP